MEQQHQQMMATALLQGQHLALLKSILFSIEELMESPQFVEKLTGEDQSFLDTIWDYFDRVTAELDPELNKPVKVDTNWEIQQDAETD